MAQLRRDHHELTKRGASVLAIGPDRPDTFRWWWKHLEMPFPGLPDPEHRVANLYGQEFKLLRLGRMPASFVVDRDGDIRYEKLGSSMSDLAATKDLTEALDALG